MGARLARWSRVTLALTFSLPAAARSSDLDAQRHLAQLDGGLASTIEGLTVVTLACLLLAVWFRRSSPWGRRAKEEEVRRSSAELERRVAERTAEVAAERERLAVTLRSIGDGVIATDIEGRITLVNGVAERLCGWRAEDAAGRPLADVLRLVDQETRKPVPDPLQLALARDEPCGLPANATLVSRDGSENLVAASVAPQHSHAGTPLGAVIVFRDVSRHVALARALKESEASLQALIESTKDIVASFDRDLRLRSFNTSFARYFLEAFRVELRPGLCIEEMYSNSWASRAQWLRSVTEAALARGQQRVEIVRADGVPVDLILSRIERDGRVVGVSLFGRDISEHRRAEKALRALSAVALRAQEEERAAFARELHDSIVQDLAALKIGINTAHAEAHGTTVCSCAKEARRQVDDILHVARELAIRLRPSILDDLGLVAALRSHAGRVSEESGIEVFVAAELGAERLAPEVETAGFRIAQEAIGNATRHSRAKGIYVRLVREEAELVLTVQDDGFGFDVAQAQRKALGAGHIGLSVMQERAAALGGHAEITSRPGQGTTVSAWLPLAAGSAPGMLP